MDRGRPHRHEEGLRWAGGNGARRAGGEPVLWARDLPAHLHTICNVGLVPSADSPWTRRMEVEFDDDDLDRLETDAQYTAGHSQEPVLLVGATVTIIRSLDLNMSLILGTSSNVNL